MSTGQTLFGDSNVGSSFGCFGVNTDWTNWLPGAYASGMLGRIVAGSYNWDASASSCGFDGANTTGHHSLFDAGTTNRVQVTGDITVGRSNGSWHTIGCSDYWQTYNSFYMGLWRNKSQSHSWHYASGSYTAGKSADDGNVSGGSNLGFGKPGGYWTVQNAEIYVFRNGSYQRAHTYVYRSGWTIPVTWIYRGGWTTLNRLPELVPLIGDLPIEFGDRPRRGVWCPVGVLGCRWCEECMVVPSELGWFGGLDVTLLGFDWRREGDHGFDPVAWQKAFASPRRNSAQTEEEIERLWMALAEKQRLRDMGVTTAALEWNWNRSVEGQMIDGWDSVKFSRRATRSFTSLMREVEPRLYAAETARRIFVTTRA